MSYPRTYDKLERMLAAQRELQELMPPLDRGPGRFRDNAARVEYVKEMVLACLDELHEALNETGWKSWSTSRHLNRDAFVGELVDAWFFLMNLLLAADVSADELERRYFEKRERNVARQRGGYDGVTGKCPGCKRSYDDPGVSCESSVEGTSMKWCSVTNDFADAGSA